MMIITLDEFLADLVDVPFDHMRDFVINLAVRSGILYILTFQLVMTNRAL